MHSANYAVARCPSVCPSVHLSVTRRYSVETAKHIIEVFPPSGIQTILVVPYQTGLEYSDGDHPVTGVSSVRGYKNHYFPPISRFISPFFDAEYLRKGTRYRQSFNGIL